MIDSELSRLEREVRASGDLNLELCLADRLLLAGRKMDAVREFGRVLESGAGDLYGLAQRGVLSSGLPWVEFDPQDRKADRPAFVRFYNVLHQGFGDAKRERYVFEWDVDLFKHERASQNYKGIDYFTQDGLCCILEDEKIERRLPTASEVHSLFLSLEWARKLGLQQVDVQITRDFLRMHLEDGFLTLSRLDYGASVVLQDFRRPQERSVMRRIYGRNNYERYVSDDPDLVRVVLNAGQSMRKLDRMYNDLLCVTKDIYV